MKTYKGFDKNMKCRGFQFEEGKEYECEGKIKACENGFHSCENPIDIFTYYSPSESIFREVEITGEIDSKSDDTKIASSKIKIGLQISLKSVINSGINFIFEKCSWKKENRATGYRAGAQATGYRAGAQATGDSAGAQATGDRAGAQATGYRAVSSTNGWYSKSEITSNDDYKSINSHAIATGPFSRVRAPLGSWIIIAEWNKSNDRILRMHTAFIDGKKYLPNVWYHPYRGKIVKCKK